MESKKTTPPSAAPAGGESARHDQKQVISELLKTADRFIKSGDFVRALEETQKALSIDPRNMYALAYEDRIRFLQEEARKKERDMQPETPPGEKKTTGAPVAEREVQRIREEELRQQAEEEAKRLQEELRRLGEEARRVSQEAQRRVEEEARRGAEAELKAKVEEARRKIEIEFKQKGEEERRRLEEEGRLRPTAEAKQKPEEAQKQLEEKIQEEAEVAKRQFQEEVEKRVEDERRKLEEVLQRKSEDERKILEERVQEKVKKEKLAAYRQLLERVWLKGGVSREEALLLKTMRNSLQIAPEEHKELELEVKLSSYIAAVRDAWKQGSIMPEDAELLDNLRRLYSIDAEQHLKIESKIRREIREQRGKGLVLVVDDEVSITKFAELILAKEGFSVITAESAEDALDLLKQNFPALVLSDINFPQPGMGGFSFFEKFKKMEHLKGVPFILMSAINEELIVQTGKRLGISDYIIKPFTREALIASVERSLKNSPLSVAHA